MGITSTLSTISLNSMYCVCVCSSVLCIPIRFIPWWLLNWLTEGRKQDRKGDGSKERKSGIGKEQGRGERDTERERSRQITERWIETEVKKERDKEGAERYVHRGEWEASSNCSLGACWADSPLLRPHQQVTYLTHAAKNTNCWCVQRVWTCAPPPHPSTFNSISFREIFSLCRGIVWRHDTAATLCKVGTALDMIS